MDRQPSQAGAVSAGGPIYHMEEYYDRLAAGDRTNIGRMFRGLPAIDDPRFGSVRTWPDYEEYVSTSAGWLSARQARLESVRTTVSAARAVLEGVLHLMEGQQSIDVPIALVGDQFAGGMSSLRIYHGMHALGLEERARLRLTPIRQILPTPVQRYWASLTTGEIASVLKQIVPGGSVYGPGGPEDVHSGDEALWRYFLSRSALRSPVRVEPSSITIEGTRCAVEYNHVTMAGPPAPAFCVFDLAPGDQIQAIHLYSDEGSRLTSRPGGE